MKKSLTLAFLILMTSHVAQACGGIVIRDKYCLSKGTMNWYSAYLWCQNQGKQMLDLEEECPVSIGQCWPWALSTDEKEYVKSNGGTVGNVWLGTDYNASQSYMMDLNTNGNIGIQQRNATHLALCK